MTIERTIERFFAVWNATTEEDRRAAVEHAWTNDGTVVDPLGDVSGHEAITGFIGEALSRFPGHRFERISAGDVHHDLVRFGWRLVAPDGSPVLEGLEVGTVAPDGRLTRTVGFFGPLPALEEVAA